MVKDTTLYDRLEIESNTPTKEIEKKGKKLLIKWHPDKNPNNVEEATKKFQEIQEAMSILTSPEKREMYDKFGMEGIKGGDGGGFNPFEGFASAFGQGFPFPGGFQGGGFPFPGGFPGQGGGFPGQGGGFPGQGGNRTPEKENIMERVDVTLNQIYNEETINVTYNQKLSCTKCNGEGTNDGNKSECKDCAGKGVKVKVQRMGPLVTQALVPCNICNGKGKIILDANKCTTCNSLGYTNKEKTIQLPLKNGFGNGIKMQLEGKGNNINGIKSDLIVIINELEHPIFKRQGYNLLIEIDLKLYQALFGFDKIISHLDGRKLHLHHSGKTNYGTIRKIVGEGMVDLRTKNKGDLIIKFKFDLPTITNETLIKALMLVDKQESINEKELIKEAGLVSTMMIDIDDKDFNNSKSSSNQEDDSQDERRGPECVQQ
jgi:DnaJ family protein A protein 2